MIATNCDIMIYKLFTSCTTENKPASISRILLALNYMLRCLCLVMLDLPLFEN